ncbi:colanic acid/amylovoran biosynthesis glycosyltransferase [Salinibacter ruber]|uniref:glycosyltransferase n=1 Tax=Salinibacter ruber TaxID=146919 RepID=UPI002168B777|nr:glycosyltransferase [Salinibacter ruber]MCS3626924.1 colanic acid/amylovoran biosynthesis glycosyltransferase [Salinibacter ruber]MCS4143824.1 colanic acid/amylovoran biosynthesis glycosyltransferase [Salinibacter ruber]
MEVAFLVGEFPNLSETFILSQITGLIDRGHDVHIYGRKPADVPTHHEEVDRYNLLDQVEYIPSLPDSKGRRLQKALQLTGEIDSPEHAWRAVRALRFWRYGHIAANLQLWYAVCALGGVERTHDVIHAHFGPNGVLAAALRDLGVLDGAVVTTFHGADMSRYFRRRGTAQYDFLARTGDVFLPISRRWKERLIQVGFPETRTSTHHMGVDCDGIEFSSVAVQGTTIRLLSVARLTEKKGIEYGIRALAQIIGDPLTGSGGDLDVNVEYTIVGDGELRAQLEQLVTELNLESNVHFTGWKSRSEVLQLLGKAHLFLAPSVTAESGDQEGIPVAIMEAMARGLPVVSTEHSGIPELVDDGTSGFLVPERDAEALARVLQSLIETPGRLPEMGRAGRQIVENEFNTEKLNDRLVCRYRAALSRTRRSMSS